MGCKPASERLHSLPTNPDDFEWTDHSQQTQCLARISSKNLSEKHVNAKQKLSNLNDGIIKTEQDEQLSIRQTTISTLPRESTTRVMSKQILMPQLSKILAEDERIESSLPDIGEETKCVLPPQFKKENDSFLIIAPFAVFPETNDEDSEAFEKMVHDLENIPYENHEIGKRLNRRSIAESAFIRDTEKRRRESKLQYSNA